MKISIITAVNDMEAYEKNVAASIDPDELITIEDADSAAQALNAGIEQASNDLCVLCHQDVIFPPGWEQGMVKAVEELLFMGVCGVWGVTLGGDLAGNVIEPRGHWATEGLPAKVQSVDELLMIVRKSSGLRFDEDLGGWHLYGADICLQAIEQGMTNYAIDAPVEHLSTGKLDEAFYLCQYDLKKKWKGRSKITNFKTPNTEITL
jgi:hypothetical protein